MYADGSVVFQDGKVVFADAIVQCTGYKYCFPFLETNGYVTVEDNRVGPLYKHVFPPAPAPGLSFIGLPSMVSKSYTTDYDGIISLIQIDLVRIRLNFMKLNRL